MISELKKICWLNFIQIRHSGATKGKKEKETSKKSKVKDEPKIKDESTVKIKEENAEFARNLEGDLRRAVERLNSEMDNEAKYAILDTKYLWFLTTLVLELNLFWFSNFLIWKKKKS